MAVSRPVPCISGGAGRVRMPGPALAVAAASSSSVSGTGPMRRAAVRVISRRSLWVQITPLGMPVVPPV
jgi:hypothetical protein